MDLSIQVRSVELLTKFVKHDLANVPSYGYAVQKPSFAQGKGEAYFPRCTPEEVGVSSIAVNRFIRDVDGEAESLGPHGIMLLRHGRVFLESYWAPYRADVPHMLYSMSKSVTATAIGMAVDEGYLKLGEKLIDIFPEMTPPSQQKNLRDLNVRHLLTMSTGMRFNEVGSMLDGNWVKMFMESVPKFEVGTAFEYNSLNSYMLAAVLKKKTGLGLVEFLRPRLFEPLGITSYEWEKCPCGIEKGGWGLALRLEDCAKLGQLYLQKGRWEGKQLVSEAWVDQAARKQIETPNGECKDGYGFQIWMNGQDAYQFNGAFGQYVVVMPKYDAVAVIFSGSAQLFADGPLMEMLKSTFWSCSDAPLPAAPALTERLLDAVGGLVVNPASQIPEGLGADPDQFARIADLLNGREYRLGSNSGGLFPATVQGVHGNYTLGTDILRFEKNGEGLDIYFYESYERNRLHVRGDGGFTDGAVASREEWQRVSTRGLWRLEEDGDIRLCLLCSFLETPDTRIITLEMCRNSMRLTFDESPSVEGATLMLFKLVGVSVTGYMKQLVASLRKLPSGSNMTVGDAIEQLTTPTADGQIIHQN